MSPTVVEKHHPLRRPSAGEERPTALDEIVEVRSVAPPHLSSPPLKTVGRNSRIVSSISAMATRAALHEDEAVLDKLLEAPKDVRAQR